MFSGLTLALLAGFANRPTQRANLFLSLALGVIVLKTVGLSAAFLPALGPLLFFYTKHLTRPQWRFQPKDWLHFGPLLVGWWMPGWLVFIAVIYKFGKTVGWQFKAGRDFSKAFATDSLGVVLNESAARLLGLSSPNHTRDSLLPLSQLNQAGIGQGFQSGVGQTFRWDGKPFRVLGVIKDMVMQSPFRPAKPTLFYVTANNVSWIFFNINPATPAAEAKPKIASVFKKLIPLASFEYRFADEEYAKKFGAEECIGQLSTVFAILTILLSCLGLLGLSSFLAEARTKGIGVRKVLGVSVVSFWGLLSKTFW